MSVLLFVVFRRFPSLTAGGERPLGGGRGGGVAHSSPLLPFLLCFVEGVPSAAFHAQCSPGPANSL